MTENGTQPTVESSDTSESQKALPHQGIVSQVVEKIKNEPFLFVIGIVAFLVSLTTLATELGSPDLRFTIIIIALLAFAVIVGYYINTVIQMRNRMRREEWKREERLRQVTPGHSPPEEVVVSPPPPTRTPAYDTRTSSARHEQPTALEQELSQHQRNMTRLRAKKGVYAAGEEPLSLLNQIEAEEREIQRIQAEMGEPQ